MANVTTPSVYKTLGQFEQVPWWRTDVTGFCYGQGFFDISRSGAFSGVVTASGTPVARAPVFLYYRPSGLLISKVWTNSDGSYVFRGLDQSSSDFFVTAYLTPYSALTLDKVTPA